MGTRSIILITDGKVNFRLYKHYDGYPTGVLPLIAAGIQGMVLASTAAELAISIVTKAPFHDSKVEHEAENRGKFKPAYLGNQGDLEWIYIIDVPAKTVNIYGGGFTGEPPQTAYKAGTVAPESYADQLKPEYQHNERQSTVAWVTAIAQLGYKVNPPKAKPKRKAV